MFLFFACRRVQLNRLAHIFNKCLCERIPSY